MFRIVDFTEIRYDDDFIWAKAYHPRTDRYFDVKVIRKEWKCEISPDDYDWEVFKAAGNLLLVLEEDNFLPEEYSVMWG